MNDSSDLASQPKTDKSPYDSIWTWSGSTAASFSVLTFIFLATGSFSLFPNTDALVQNDLKATVAFYGLLVCTVSMAVLGVIAIVFSRSRFAQKRIPWPRFKIIEDEMRTPFVARLALFGVLFPPVINTIASAIAYYRTSHIARWNATNPLAADFVESRMIAMSVDCPKQPCFRFAARDGVEPSAHQWFLFSDILLVISFAAAVALWITFVQRVRRLNKTI